MSSPPNSSSRRKRPAEQQRDSKDQKPFGRGRGKREGGTPPNGNNRPAVVPIPVDQVTQQLNPSESTGDAMHDRSLWLLMNLVGKRVEVQVRSGELFEGILHTVSTEKGSGIGVVLRMARKKEVAVKGKAVTHTTRPVDTLVIHPADFGQLYAKDVSFDIRSEREFATDTDISAHMHGGAPRERELQPWCPDPQDPNSSIDLSLEARHTQWDQFAVNKDKFGVTTSWDEDLYTTPLNRETEDYKKRQREAAKIAQEIEKGTSSSNFHVMEERGIENEVNEEDRYGAVIREPVPGKVPGMGGKYIPPAKRAMMRQAQPHLQPQTAEAKDVPDTDKSEPKAVPTKDTGPPVPPLSQQGSFHEQLSLGSSRSGSSRGSPTSPRSPRSLSALVSPGKGGETHAIVSERLRLRLNMVSERFKNSAPIPSQPTKDGSEQSFPSSANRSPLLSPLVGDARGINSLHLEPGTPNLEEKIISDFYAFSLNRESKKHNQETQRVRTLSDFKNFSKALETKVPVLKGSKPSTPQPSSPTIKPASTKAPATTQAPATTPASTPPTNSTPATPSATPPASTPTATPPPSEESKLKLNPNSKVFKPMSAAAPEFNPGRSTTSVPTSPPSTGHEGMGDMYGRPLTEDPYARPFYPPNYPFPMPPMGYQMRMMPGPQGMPGYPPYPPYGYPMPGGPMPQGQQPHGPNKPQVPGPTPQGRGALSPQLKPGQPTPYPMGFIPGRGMPAPYYQQYAMQMMPPGMVEGGAYMRQQYEGDKGSPQAQSQGRFQAPVVPNTDKMPPPAREERPKR